ncbi:hypothetical protein N7605_13415 [Pantoea ananatis]|uniref:hypothetical protein n=1 Tax=Pantoea ananas TaxID=553 RepID=UPI000ABC538D|nr:hypothetical protein [Pantoea ananatis]MDS7720805.1 hypothetical protein [Pantoea ananatis]
MDEDDERPCIIITAIGKAVLELLDVKEGFFDLELAEILEDWMIGETNPLQAQVYRIAAAFVRAGGNKLKRPALHRQKLLQGKIQQSMLTDGGSIQ